MVVVAMVVVAMVTVPPNSYHSLRGGG
jgi:hypothetical protein